MKEVMMMTYEEMKAKKEALEKDLAELNKEIFKYEGMIYKGKLNKAIALLEECGYYYGMDVTVEEMTCPSCLDVIDIEFGDIIDMLEKFAE
jgi:anaerobic ribonucleoside-triphosphate reductase